MGLTSAHAMSGASKEASPSEPTRGSSTPGSTSRTGRRRDRLAARRRRERQVAGADFRPESADDGRDSFRATEADLADSRSVDDAAARQPATRRPRLVLPVLGVDGVPPVGSGLRRTTPDFSEDGVIARESNT